MVCLLFSKYIMFRLYYCLNTVVVSAILYIRVYCIRACILFGWCFVSSLCYEQYFFCFYITIFFYLCQNLATRNSQQYVVDTWCNIKSFIWQHERMFHRTTYLRVHDYFLLRPKNARVGKIILLPSNSVWS